MNRFCHLPRRRLSALLALLAFLPLLATGARAGVDLELVAGGFVQPTVVTGSGDGRGRLFVVEQPGRIRVVTEGVVASRPFLDIADRVFSSGGNGLLGLAFHPDFSANRYFFVHYISLDRRTTISRFRLSNDPERAVASSETVVFALDEEAGSHKGGDLAFGPDGFLYVALGDGSSGGDPDDNAQNLSNLFGTVLRLDVDGVPAVAPPDNPFVGDAAARDEIWAYGLRNPWRLSFDSATGDLFIADVGELTLEEVNRQPGSSRGGENYGWRLREGSRCFEPATGCGAEGLVPPILEYGRRLGCSVTGGYVYRGDRAPTLHGSYLYSDFCAGTIWAAEPNREGVWASRLLARTLRSIVTFGRDDSGELYVADYATGSVFRLTTRELFVSGFESGGLRGWRRRGSVEVMAPGIARSGYALAVSPQRSPAAVLRRMAPLDHIETEITLDLSELDLAGGVAEVARWEDGRGPLLQLQARRVSPGRHSLVLFAPDGSASSPVVASFRAGRRRVLQFVIEWRAASAPGASDGTARLSERGRERGSIEGLTTGGRAIKTLEIGFPGGAPQGASGRLLVDDVVVSAGRP